MKPLLSGRLRQRRYTVAQPFISGSVLDVGCGQADLLTFMPHIQHYVGLDIQPALLAHAQQQHPQQHFYLTNLEGDPLPADVSNQRFETITMFAILEHLAQPQAAFQQIAGLLAPNGRIVATTPSPFGHRVHRLGAQVGLFYREAADDHKSILDQQQLQQMIAAIGLRVELYQSFQFGCNQLVVASA